MTISLLVAAVAVAALSSCGKRNIPKPPPGVEQEYPRQYPSR